MPGRRIEMRKLKEVLRLRFLAGLSRRKIAQCTGVGKSTVSEHVGQAERLGLTWEKIEPMPEAEIEALLYSTPSSGEAAGFVEPDWGWVAKELRRKHVTKHLLWEEYSGSCNGRPYSYSRFCERYASWKGGIEPSMRFEHVAGEKCFVDYAGMTLTVVDPETGAEREAQVFVATLGASNYTFVDVTWTQQGIDFYESHVRALEFFGGAPLIFVLDNLKAGVTNPDWYEPDVNRTYADLLGHYGAVAIPGRPRKPRDKAKVESSVLHVERRVLAPLRDRTLIGLQDARTAVWELTDQLNARPFQKIPGSRQSLFEELDKPALQSLPPQRWVHCEWKDVTVNIDYHVEVLKRFYSVPYQYLGECLQAKVTGSLVEIYRCGRVLTTHRRATTKRYSTKPEHMPSSHREYKEWNPPRVVARANEIGPAVAELVRRLLESRKHPEQGYRPCLGIVRLADKFGEDRLDAACRRALAHSAYSYKSVKSILDKGLDRIEDNDAEAPPLPDHSNVRGGEAYAAGGRSC